MDQAILLAAGEGTRMKSKRHKVLHPLCGRPMIEYELDALHEVGVEKPVVVIGHSAEDVRAHLGGRAAYAVQDMEKGRGTGGAALAGAQMLAAQEGYMFVLAGDMPLLTGETLRKLRQGAQGAAAAVLTARFANPYGYGRVIREGNAVCAIVEQNELIGAQQELDEVCVLVYCVQAGQLRRLLPSLTPHAIAGKAPELYITDLIALLNAQGERVAAVEASEEECLGVNDRVQLAQAEAAMRGRINRRHMLGGVTLIDPAATYIEAGVTIGADTVIYPGCTLQGNTQIGEGCTLLPNCRLLNAQVAQGVTIESSVLLDCQVGAGTTVGPNAYLRPNARIGSHCRIGDFVEIKNSSVGDGTKVSHLTYVGDADLGERINLGCGVVFVNYDGKKKSRSVVEDDAFIGCNVNLIAPVHVGQGAYIAAGSTLTHDVPGGALSIARERQRNLEGWVEARKRDGKL